MTNYVLGQQQRRRRRQRRRQKMAKLPSLTLFLWLKARAVTARPSVKRQENAHKLLRQGSLDAGVRVTGILNDRGTKIDQRLVG